MYQTHTCLEQSEARVGTLSVAPKEKQSIHPDRVRCHPNRSIKGSILKYQGSIWDSISDPTSLQVIMTPTSESRPGTIPKTRRAAQRRGPVTSKSDLHGTVMKSLPLNHALHVVGEQVIKEISLKGKKTEISFLTIRRGFDGFKFCDS